LHEMGDIERGVEVGTNDFISKPVNRTDLLTRVKALLCVRQAQADGADPIDGPA
jgi:two-component system alkaline phosphatase synthesis response regulator PhoP